MGILVVEAPKKSDALITAYSALEENRDVFSIPGQVNSKKSEGTNNIIKSGHAKLVQTVDDILSELPEYALQSRQTKQASLPLEQSVDLTKEENNLIKLFDHSELHID